MIKKKKMKILLTLFLSLSLLSCKKDELSFVKKLDNYSHIHKAFDEANINSGYMNDIPEEGSITLHINCDEKDFQKAIKIAQQFQLEAKFEIQIISPTKIFIKNSNEEKNLTVPKKPKS